MKTFLLYPSLLVLALATPALALPKYGPDAVPLSKRSNLDYFKENPAADFWSLIPYYLPQSTKTGCSAANLAMILNGARVGLPLTTADEQVTFDNLLDKYTDDRYKKAMTFKMVKGVYFKHGEVANSRLAEVLKEASDKLKLTNPETKVELVNIDPKNPAKSRQTFYDNLKQNEKSADDFIVISFIQGKLTGDPEGMVAHVATIGAYDEKRNLILILDPDREWYEPYWSPADKVFDAIQDPKSDAEHPGYIYFKVR